MAKSPVGGSRAYITGRIGSDVYSLGKDGKGKRQQIVRALAEEVANPRTQSQMFNRMVMSSVMQAVHGLKQIIDHSFDGLPTGQPCISEFIRRNYALAKADAIQNHGYMPGFGMVKYGEKGARPGQFVVSSGKLVKSSKLVGNQNNMFFNVGTGNLNVGALRSVMNVSKDGYVTWIRITASRGVEFFRCFLDPSLADSTAITADNVNTLFTFEGNVTPTCEVASDRIKVVLPAVSEGSSYGPILSDKVNGKWQHSTCTLEKFGSITFTADEAIPTYPVGDEMFLNGGEI